jgi:hypothetical protein
MKRHSSSVPRNASLTRTIVAAKSNPRPFALSKRRFYGDSTLLKTGIQNAARNRRPITLAEHA